MKYTTYIMYTYIYYVLHIIYMYMYIYIYICIAHHISYIIYEI